MVILYRQRDYISAGLDLLGAIPFIGEVADAAKTARTADRIIDGVKAADKTIDVVKTADKAVDTLQAVDDVSDAAKATSSMKEIFDAAEDPIAEMTKRTKEIATRSPVKIPEGATIKPQVKNSGAYQIKYEWVAEGGFEYTSRWHTPRPNVPIEEYDVWVVERKVPGIGYGKNRRDPVEQVLVGENKWVSKDEWDAARWARGRGTITKIQEEMLNNGHRKA